MGATLSRSPLWFRLIGIAAMLTLACHPTKAKQQMQDKPKPLPMVTLTVTQLKIDHDALLIEYCIQNETDRAILLVNKLYRVTQNKTVIDPALFYTVVDGKTIQLRKALIPIPDEIDVAAPDVPYLTPIAPGTSFHEKVTVPLPIELHYPYPERLMRSVVDTRTYDRLELAFSWFPDPERRTTVSSDQAHEVRRRYGTIVEEQKLLVYSTAIRIETHIAPVN
jgi:hypothetical protein